MDFVFGAPAISRDEVHAGTVKRLLIVPGTREVTHLIIQSPQASEDLLIPLNMIQGIHGNQVVLYVTSHDLDNMPRYYEGRESSPPAGRVDVSAVREPVERRSQLEDALNVADDALDLGPETDVITTDKKQGTLRGLMVDEYVNRLTRLHVDGLGNAEVTIDARWIGELRSGIIELNATREQLDEPVRSEQEPYIVTETGEVHDTVEHESHS